MWSALKFNEPKKRPPTSKKRPGTSKSRPTTGRQATSLELNRQPTNMTRQQTSFEMTRQPTQANMNRPGTSGISRAPTSSDMRAPNANMRLPTLGRPDNAQAARNPGVSYGLDSLTMIEKVYIRQPVYKGEVQRDKFIVRRTQGEPMFVAAVDDSSSFSTNFCTQKGQSYDLKLYDNQDKPLMKVSKQFKCLGSCCCWCSGLCNPCSYSFTIEAPVSSVIAHVKQKSSLFRPTYSVLDESENEIYILEGPLFHGCLGEYCCPDRDKYKFKVISTDTNMQVALLGWQFQDDANNAVRITDNFGITFPVDMNVKHKSILIGVYFFLDLLYFENKTKLNSS